MDVAFLLDKYFKDGKKVSIDVFDAHTLNNVFSLTDMVRNIDNGLALIEKWLRNKNTIEFLGIWESMYNPGFNSPEFEGIKMVIMPNDELPLGKLPLGNIVYPCGTELVM